jgi:hypothetical protein
MSRMGPSARGFFENDLVPLASAKESKDRFEVSWAIAAVTGFEGYRDDDVRAKIEACRRDFRRAILIVT